MNTARVHIIPLLTLFVTLFPATLLFAQTPTSPIATTTPVSIGQSLHSEPPRTRMGQATELMRTRIIERRSLFADAVKYRVKNLLDNVHNRMQTTVKRFEQITMRLDSRMAKLEAKGINTAEARVPLATATTDIALARELLSHNIDRDVDAVVDDASPLERLALLRTYVATVFHHLSSAHTALTATVQLLKTAADQPAANGGSETVASSTSIE